MIVKPGGKLFLREFTDGTDDIKKMSDGEAVDSSLYTVTAVSDLTATIVENKTNSSVVSFAVDPILMAGESIFYVDSNGLERNNKVTAVGRSGKYEFNETLKGLSVGGTVTVFRTNTIVTLDSDFEEGVYFITPTNEQIIVRNSYADPYITYSEMTLYLPDLRNLEESEIQEMNDRARDKIYADIIDFERYFDMIYESDLRVLKIRAILCIYSHRFEITTDIEGNINYCEDYQKSLDSFRIRFKTAAEGQDGNYKPTDGVPEEFQSGRFTL